MSNLTDSDLAKLGEHAEIAADKNRRLMNGWHLKKEVNVSLIITVVVTAFGCIGGYFDLKRDVALIQADLLGVHVKEKDFFANDDRNLATIRAQYDRMESKLDRLIERQK
jgi:hypothetical protein